MGNQARKKQSRKRIENLVVQLYATYAGEIMDKYLAPTRCLNGTRIAIEVFEHFHVPLKPVIANTLMMSAGYWAKVIANNGRFPDTFEEIKAWTSEEGVWSIGVGAMAGGAGFPFHLIAISSRWLVDSAAIQFNKTEKGIHTPHILVGPLQGRPRDGQDCIYHGEGGTVAMYSLDLVKDNFYDKPGFQRSEENISIAREIILELRKNLQEHLEKRRKS